MVHLKRQNSHSNGPICFEDPPVTDQSKMYSAKWATGGILGPDSIRYTSLHNILINTFFPSFINKSTFVYNNGTFMMINNSLLFIFTKPVKKAESELLSFFPPKWRDIKNKKCLQIWTLLLSNRGNMCKIS